ncbi:extracellular solute-binding protein [Paenibacillus sp. BC26]|uniref:extracellular solute-binding protein n=1 Tax=Paenibacillus sp. BC26 TaxID=1881032 RepID=UPI0008E38E54|nr:extracellular solute-binding protein [Paenibacillus sp. BC26]SFS74140.1 ABC-type glycerol-3-phosphate transport system, substrate-binding protein [Paenibacillus sp. BC26]
MKVKTFASVFVFVLIFSLAAPTSLVFSSTNNLPRSDENIISGISSSTDYEDYLASFNSNEKSSESLTPITIDVMHYSSAANVEPVGNFLGRSGLLTKDNSTVEYEITAPHAGLYTMYIEYSSTEQGSSDPERALLINGSVPYNTAGDLSFPRLWKSKTEIKQDPRGNDIRPFQITYPQWQTLFMRDARGFNMKPLEFYLNEGKNTIALHALREEMIIGSLTLQAPEPYPAYDQALKSWQQQGYTPSDAKIQFIEGESAIATNDPTLYPISDRSSPKVSPYRGSKIAINAIGGNNWKKSNQQISWTVHIDEAGLYQLALKGKQNLSPGRISYRRLLIDGKVPFSEVEVIPFKYSTKWKNYLFGDDHGDPFWFGLEPGEHTITLEPVLGGLGEIVHQIEESVASLNDAYRQIIAITGSTPDAYRDYALDEYLPGIMVVFERESKMLSKLSQSLSALTGSRSSESALIKNSSAQLESFVRKPETIAKRLSSFKSNLAGMATLILTLGEQPLTIDYIMAGRLEGEMPKAEANIFERMSHEVRIFVSSFFEDYDAIGTVSTEQQDSIDLWMVTGRDQAQVVKQMIEQSFTPQTGISVNLKLVQSGNLLPSVLSGINPDVAIQVGMADPVNYAMRGALMDLSKFKDFDEVKGRFLDSAVVPYQLADGVYGLPETQSFLLMFYRRDILESLGIAPPQTWDEMVHVLSVLQENNLEIGLPFSNVETSGYGTLNGGMETFMTFLLQKGGALYRDGGRVSNLDSEVAIKAFDQWSSFYSNYKIPLVFDFANRFRLGEMPLAIQDYTAYNMLSVFAPEIKGLWGFTVVPGTKQADGSTNRAVPFVGTSSIMFKKDNDHPEESWEFLKWWTSANVQELYGREMENLQGAAARYPTANVEALSRLPWTTSEYKVIRTQMDEVVGTPEVPGGYFTPRHIDNAFRSTVMTQPPKSPRDAILDYIKYINEELEIKQREFVNRK